MGEGEGGEGNSEGEGNGTGGDGTTTSWKDSLPEEWRDAPLIGKATDAADALQQINNAAQYMGNSIRIPGSDAGEDDWKSFRTKIQEKVPDMMMKPDMSNPESIKETFKYLGVPKGPDEYKYSIPDGRDALPGSEFVRKMAHESGITQSQFEKFIGGMMANEYEREDQANVIHKEEMASLHKEWGFSTDHKMDAVANWLKLTDAPESIQGLAANKSMSAADYMWLHGVATSTKSNSELTNLPKDESSALLSPGEAGVKIQEMLDNGEHAYWNAAHRGHKAAINRMVELQRMTMGT